jgi:transcriptional regulator with XRE-family HTH domain
MKVHDKLKVMRLFKGWSQEEMAEKLGYSLSGYTKIERGETDLNISKLEKISETMGIDLDKLLGMNESNVFNLAANATLNCTQNNLAPHCTIILSEAQCAHELEKCQLLLQERNKEIEQLKQQIIQLQEINALLKESKFQ